MRDKAINFDQSMIERKFSEMDINLDDEAARVLTSSAQAVRVILDRRGALDKAGQYDLPLIVFSGEFHDYPADIMQFMSVMKDVSRYEKTAFCTEVAHDCVESNFKEWQNANPSKQTITALKNLDIAGALSLETCIGLEFMADAPYANKILQGYVLDQGISTQFTDTAYKGMLLNPDDSSTRASIRRCFNKLTDYSSIDVTNRMGMMIRNDHMLKKTMAHIPHHDARIILFKGGSSHMAGSVGGGYPAAESLAVMGKKDAAVIAMPMIHDGLQVPSNHGLAQEEFFPIEEFSQVMTRYNPWTDKPLRGQWRRALLENTAEEAAYVNGLLERTGFQDCVLTVAQYGELIGLKKQKVLQDFKACERVPSIAF